jgi:hypothetical protein
VVLEKVAVKVAQVVQVAAEVEMRLTQVLKLAVLLPLLVKVTLVEIEFLATVTVWVLEVAVLEQ